MNLQRVKKLSADKKFLPIKDGCRELAPCRGQGRAALVGFGAKPQQIRLAKGSCIRIQSESRSRYG